MKDAKDPGTADLFVKRRPGRPKQANAKTPAQRAREYRRRRAEHGAGVVLLSSWERLAIADALALAASFNSRSVAAGMPPADLLALADRLR